MNEKAEPLVGECGSCGTVTQVVDYFGDCVCRVCAAAEAEEGSAAPADREPPAAIPGSPPRPASRSLG